MSTDDAGILTPILLATVAALVVIRLTFRNAANARAALITPSVFAVCGALVGISIGMIWFADREGRVTIETGMMLLVCGASLGASAGLGAKHVYSRLNRGKAAVFLLVTMLLAGSIGAPMGWTVGNLSEPPAGQFEHQRELWWASQMMWGMAIGSGMGLFLGLSDVVLRRRGAT